MAFYNSIALGTASGKLGNLIFQAYKKMKIVRQKNETTSNLNAPLRLHVKNKMKNMSTLWGSLQWFFAEYSNTIKYGETNYNLFIRTFFPKIWNQYLPSVALVYDNMVLSDYPSSKFCHSMNIVKTGMLEVGFKYEFMFNYPSPDFNPNLRYRMLVTDYHFQQKIEIDLPITELMFAGELIHMEQNLPANYVNCMAYIYETTSDNCSNLTFYINP